MVGALGFWVVPFPLANRSLRFADLHDLGSGSPMRRAASSRRSLPISRLCLANTRRPKRNGALSSRRRESLSVSSFAVERSDVSTRSLERPPGFPLSSHGTGDKETGECPLNRLKAPTNEGLTDARSRLLPGRLLTSSCCTVRLTNLASHAGQPERRSDKPRKKAAPEQAVLRGSEDYTSRASKTRHRWFDSPNCMVAP